VSTSRPVARARGLVKSYGGGPAAVCVLDGVDLDVWAGELVAVVGRSGSGKSTLLHLLGALDRPDDGTVEVAGRRLERMDERVLSEVRRRHVGFVFQSFHLLPELTGLENVLLPARLARAASHAAERARELLAELELEHAAERLPGQLSGGEQQRLSLARALINDPQLVLADEPTGNLDLESGTSVLRLLREAARGARGAVLVSHDREAAALADRVLELEGGRLKA
jgi:ABC-type lipoprotein export system ATPase subunit